jgi:alanyl aminopeptidase
VRDGRSARALGLALDPRLNPLEMSLLLRRQLAHWRTRPAALSFIGRNWRRMRERLSNAELGTWPAMFGGFCSDARADRVQELFAPYVEQMPGGPRELAQTLERIRLCAARVKAQRASVQAYFAERPTP